MKGNYSTPVNPRDLSSHLDRIKSHSEPNDGDAVSRLPRMSTRSGTGATSFTGSSRTSTNNMELDHLPTFTKSSTMSTNSSSDSADSRFSRWEVRGMRTSPLSARESKQSAEVGRGEFSKPRVPRRRVSNESSKSEGAGEFRYYGRHANTWLFNDFSITDSVKKGWGKVFSGKDDHEGR